MSRRRGEFEHRTSIFEGAFRAWSHLGGLDPEDVESKPTAEIDPLAAPIENDPRVISQKKSGDMKEAKNPDGTPRREYPYEALPRSGLAHPYVQAILSPWLGPDADNDAIQLGLTTLRTWWQHRRKGESGSAIAALGTEKMKGVVEGYTRHFFTLAHCLVTQDKEPPPRTLQTRMKELDKARSKRNKGKKGMDNAGAGQLGPPDLVSDINGDLTDSKLSPLERLHAAQRRQLATNGLIHSDMPASTQLDVTNRPAPGPAIQVKGKCLPGKIDLPGLVDQVNHAANQLAHRGGSGTAVSPLVTNNDNGIAAQQQPIQANTQNYGDPNKTPVVYVSARGDIMIAMEIDGITCAHCVKIVETVLKGCSGNKSPIEGLLDAAADMKLNALLIKIEKASYAKRVAFESKRNLSMVGYTSRVKEMNIVGAGADKKSTTDLGKLSTAFDVVASIEPKVVFDWSIPCTCPDNGIMREACGRHGQMNDQIFDAFDSRAKQVVDYMAGCGMKYGMACTCGSGCTCKNCPTHPKDTVNSNAHDMEDQLDSNEEAQIRDAASRMQPQVQLEIPALMPPPGPIQASIGQGVLPVAEDEPIHVEQKMDFFPLDQTGMGGNGVGLNGGHHQRALYDMEPIMDHGDMGSTARHSQRNPSIISYGGLRQMSMNSETIGRAMSGLSALSIDWENLEDFDVNVDHSAHINNESPQGRIVGGGADMQHFNNGRPFSFRRPDIGQNSDAEAHLSSKLL